MGPSVFVQITQALTNSDQEKSLRDSQTGEQSLGVFDLAFPWSVFFTLIGKGTFVTRRFWMDAHQAYD